MTKDERDALVTAIFAGAATPAERMKRAVAALPQLGDDAGSLGRLGSQAGSLVDRNDLNAAPREPEFFDALVDRLSEAVRAESDPGRIRSLWGAIATAGHRGGRRFDARVDEAYGHRTFAPDATGSDHYNYGLYLKTRGQFEEGLAQNLRALELEPDNIAALWNAAICATGCGRGELALEIETEGLGMTLTMASDGLPEGGFPSAQVRLAERPVTERTADDDDPGAEETIWIRRLSACHGVVISALYADLGVDYGDVVLFDGAPIVERTWGERTVPVFPHLATLRRPGYRIWPMAGQQPEERGIAMLSDALPDDAILYSHTEGFRVLCPACWADTERDHTAHESRKHHIVIGRIAVGPDTALADVAAALDAAIAEKRSGGAPWQVLVPGLWEALGDTDRASVERRRMALVNGTRSQA